MFCFCGEEEGDSKTKTQYKNLTFLLKKYSEKSQHPKYVFKCLWLLTGYFLPWSTDLKKAVSLSWNSYKVQLSNLNLWLHMNSERHQSSSILTWNWQENLPWLQNYIFKNPLLCYDFLALVLFLKNKFLISYFTNLPRICNLDMIIYKI